MGFLRGAGVVIISVLLFLSLLVGGVCLTLGMSLKYENVQPTVVNLSGNIISQSVDLNSVVQEAGPLIQEYCKNNSEYVFSQGDQVFVIPCKIVNQGNEAIVNYILNDSITGVVNEYYYKDYNCTFVKCIKNGEVTSLISKQARDYWISKFYMFFIISIAFIVLLFLLIEKKNNWFFLIGSLFVIDSLLISKLGKIGTWIAKVFLTSVKEIFSGETPQDVITQIVSLFFVESRTVFYLMLGIGIILLVLGVVFDLFKIGFKINKIFEKSKEEDAKKENVSKEEVKEIVEKEIKEKVKEEISKDKNRDSSSKKK
jgi:hypothetical protein